MQRQVALNREVAVDGEAAVLFKVAGNSVKARKRSKHLRSDGAHVLLRPSRRLWSPDPQSLAPGLEIRLRRPSSGGRCLGSVAIDKGNQLLCLIGEELKFAGVQRLAQPLKQEQVRALSRSRSQAAEEEAETAGRIGQERKTGVVDRSGKLNRARPSA